MLLTLVFSYPTIFNIWGIHARGKWLQLLFNNRRIGISFFTVSGHFRKHQAWPSINWMIRAISTRSKRLECDADTTVSSQELSIHYFSIRKICRLFSFVHEIFPCKWAAHVSIFTEGAERGIMCSLRDRNWGRRKFLYVRQGVFYVHKSWGCRTSGAYNIYHTTNKGQSYDKWN